jgi:hypothetical protein
MSLIINDNVDAKVVINFQKELMNLDEVKKSMDIEITELVNQSSTSESSAPTSTSTRTQEEWQALCSSSLSALGYPNDVEANGLKVVSYDSYYNILNQMNELTLTTTRAADQILVFSQLIDDVNALFETIKAKLGDANAYSETLYNANLLTEKINEMITIRKISFEAEKGIM